jgi:hypothetical protein
MWATSWGRLLPLSPILVIPLLGLACGDFKLPRGLVRTGADSVTDSVDPPKASAGRRRSRETPASDPALDQENFARIRRTLRRLVTAEETFFAENGTYSEDLVHIGFNPEREVEVRFLWMSKGGWAASGTHPDLSGRDCVTFVGEAKAPPTTLKYVRHGRQGVPVCDDFPRAAEPVVSSPPGPPKPPAPPDTGSALDALKPAVAMKVDLRNLVRSQETYYATQGTYARRTETLALQYLWHRDVRVKILSADAQSWAAKATHARAPGQSCVIWFGSVSQRPVTDGRRLQPEISGVPVCDE